MDGLFKKLVFILLFLSVLGCKKGDLQLHEDKLRADKLHKNKLIVEARNFINENCNILIDSINQFDIKSFDKKSKSPKLTIGLIDSISCVGYNCLAFKLKGNDLRNFKSTHKLKLVKTKTYDSDVLFVTFSNFRLEKDFASIIIEKVRGIGMSKERYEFKKENGKWILIKKRLLNLS